MSYYEMWNHYNGIVIDFIAMILCGTAGKLGKKTFHMSSGFEDICFTGIALSCILVGISGINISDPIVCSLALLAGPVIGHVTKFDVKINTIIKKIAVIIFRCDSEEAEQLETPFIGFLMLTMVGTLSVNGPIQNLNGDVSLMIVKSCLDGLTALIFTLTYPKRRGSVVFLAIPIVLFSEIIVAVIVTMTESFIFINCMNDIASVGSVLLIVLGMNLLNISSIDTSRLLPSLLIVPLVSIFI